jgi:hypothetical protein
MSHAQLFNGELRQRWLRASPECIAGLAERLGQRSWYVANPRREAKCLKNAPHHFGDWTWVTATDHI